MNEQLQKIKELLESRDIGDKKLGSQLLEQYRCTVKIDPDTLVKGMAYQVVRVSYPGGFSPQLNVTTQFPFDGVETVNGKVVILLFDKKRWMFDRILSITPTSEPVYTYKVHL